MYNVRIAFKYISILVIVQDLELEVEQSCQAGQKFSELYYDTVDKKRHVSIW